MWRTVGQTGKGIEEFCNVVGDDVVLARCVSVQISARVLYSELTSSQKL